MHLTISFALLVGILYGYTTSTTASDNAVSTPLGDHVNLRELPICKGRATKPCDPLMVPRDCYDIQQICGSNSGIFYIFPSNDDAVEVYCDMKTEQGGWLVFQRRDDGSVDFYRGWDDYKNGFGSYFGEFWLGNQNLHFITSYGRFELRVDLEDFDGERAYAYYDNFEIKSEGENFKLVIGAYEGNAGDSLTQFHNNQAFTTYDKDNDAWPHNCAQSFKGAWWYSNCHHSNLNGLYLEGPHDSHANGVNWGSWRGHYYSLKLTEMKIRPYGYYHPVA